MTSQTSFCQSTMICLARAGGVPVPGPNSQHMDIWLLCSQNEGQTGLQLLGTRHVGTIAQGRWALVRCAEHFPSGSSDDSLGRAGGDLQRSALSTVLQRSQDSTSAEWHLWMLPSRSTIVVSEVHELSGRQNPEKQRFIN